MWVAVLLLAILGGVLSGGIAFRKNRKTPHVCADRRCAHALDGRFSRLFGVPQEILGLAYYGASALWAILALLPGNGSLPSPLLTFFTVAISTAALYALTLLFLRVFVLRARCVICTLSVLPSLGIFLLLGPF